MGERWEKGLIFFYIFFSREIILLREYIYINIYTKVNPEALKLCTFVVMFVIIYCC